MSRRIATAAARIAAAFAGCLLVAASLPASAITLPAGKSPIAAGAIARAAVLEGELQVEVADYPDRTATIHHFLKTPSGERHELRFRAGQLRQRLLSGTRVRVKGLLSDHVLTAEASPTPIGPAPTDVAAAMPYAVGVQKTAVILVNFQDKVSSPQTPSAVQSLVFGQVSNFYLENSFQTTSVSGNVFGWYTIPVSSTSCDRDAIKSYARSAATAAGADLSSYSRFVYIFPNTSACSWAGYGMIGGSPTDAWINGYFDRRIIAHELGHNLGLHHAHSQECGGTSVGSSCSTSEYGDLVDTMGWGLYGHFSAYQKETLGWLNYGGMPPITTVQSSGRYDLVPYVAGTGGAKALKILKGTDPTTGDKTWYYVEYRQPTGFDNVLSGTGNLTSGVLIHTASASGGAFLLDMTPGSDYTSEYNDLKDAALVAGKTFTDSAAGITVDVLRADATGATVNVSLANGGTSTACTRVKPSVAISPSQSSGVAPGTAVKYTVAVTNNDSATCGSSTFNLGKTVPAGWSGTLGAASLAIGAGSAASTTLTATSPTTAAGGSYSVGASATSGVSSLAGSVAATYTVNAPAYTLSENVSVSQWSYPRGSTVTTVSTVKSNGTPVANASVTFKLTKSNGYMVYYTTTTDKNGQAFFPYQISSSDPTGAYRSGATATANGVSAYTSVSFTVM